MQIVIDILENQIKISEERLKIAHYPVAIEPSVRMKIEACKDAIKVLDSERWKRIKASEKQEPKALIIDGVSKSFYCNNSENDYKDTICKEQCTICKWQAEAKQ